MLLVMEETRGRVTENQFQEERVDLDESEDLRPIGNPPKTKEEILGEQCAPKGASTVRRGGVDVPEQSGLGLLPDPSMVKAGLLEP
jgi:hypothetical protein